MLMNSILERMYEGKQIRIYDFQPKDENLHGQILYQIYV